MNVLDEKKFREYLRFYTANSPLGYRFIHVITVSQPINKLIHQIGSELKLNYHITAADLYKENKIGLYHELTDLIRQGKQIFLYLSTDQLEDIYNELKNWRDYGKFPSYCKLNDFHTKFWHRSRLFLVIMPIDWLNPRLHQTVYQLADAII